MTWMLVLQISILLVVAGVVIAVMIGVYGQMTEGIRQMTIEQIGSQVINNYLPKAADIEIKMTEKVMDKICDKIPDMMEKTMESAKKMMEEL